VFPWRVKALRIANLTSPRKSTTPITHAANPASHCPFVPACPFVQHAHGNLQIPVDTACPSLYKNTGECIFSPCHEYWENVPPRPDPPHCRGPLHLQSGGVAPTPRRAETARHRPSKRPLQSHAEPQRASSWPRASLCPRCERNCQQLQPAPTSDERDLSKLSAKRSSHAAVELPGCHRSLQRHRNTRASVEPPCHR